MPTGLRLRSILELYFNNINIYLICYSKNLNNYLKLVIKFSVKYTKRYLNSKAEYIFFLFNWVFRLYYINLLFRKTFFIPEIIFNSNLFFSFYIFLFAIFFCYRVFLLEKLNNYFQILSIFKINSSKYELYLKLKNEIKS